MRHAGPPDKQNLLFAFNPAFRDHGGDEDSPMRRCSLIVGWIAPRLQSRCHPAYQQLRRGRLGLSALSALFAVLLSPIMSSDLRSIKTPRVGSRGEGLARGGLGVRVERGDAPIRGSCALSESTSCTSSAALEYLGRAQDDIDTKVRCLSSISATTRSQRMQIS